MKNFLLGSVLVALLFLVAIAGLSFVLYRSSQTESDVLPLGAYNITNLGRGWYTFNLKLGYDKPRRFLYHREYMRVSNANVECITELVE